MRVAALRTAFRRDRLTGQVAAGLTGVLVIAAVVYGVGTASARYRLADVGAWLNAGARGLAVHVNGPAGKVDGRTALPAQMRGHRIQVVQDGATVLLVDLDTGVVSRIDPSQLAVGRNRALGAGIQVLAAAGRAYTVDSVKGVVQQIDPVSLTPAGPSATLPPPLGGAGIDARGALWVPVAGKGQVTAFRDGRLQAPVPVGRPGDALALTIAAGDPVVVDSSAATATVLKASGARLAVALPSTVRTARAGGVLAPPVAEGATVPLLVPGTGSLVTVDTGTGRHTTARLAVPRHRYRAPQMLGAKVYIPDETAGALLVYDTAGNRFEAPVPVTGRPSRLEVLVKDGLLWANDPAGPRAVVIDREGGRKGIDKYADRVPGGPKRHGLPTPGAGTAPSAPAEPVADPTRPAAPAGPPRPGQPPGAPSNIAVTPGAGTMRVDFQPSQGTGVTGYALKDVPAGLSVSPRTTGPGGPFTFTLKGGDCGREYRFRVAVQYRDGRNRAGERVSVASDPVRPCVTPGAPGKVSATATASGARLSWTPPPGGATSYKVTWDGPVQGTQTVTSASATLGTVWTNGSYTFSVAAVNAAGTGAASTSSASLTGPVQRYAVRSNGNSNGYIRSTADADNGALVATMHDNNGEVVDVHCQEKGVYYRHPNDSSLAGDMYAQITWNGKTGYVIGWLISTPGDWTSPAGPTVWACK
ncbi:fibronectin type III domain-containing protein [Actinomadura fibrosa]|uniref:Fibronectin type III domain-containing protein n=1 Tax=Actinomadura fibrosa TaxID=111802 RepID=A0ABW2XGG8_9ACTN|nr:fibronectin type III domain-containing protein [Actinomadura fibrosa]